MSGIMTQFEEYLSVLEKINEDTSQASLSKIARRFDYPDLERAFKIDGLTRLSFLDLVTRFKKRFVRDYAPGGLRKWPETPKEQ